MVFINKKFKLINDNKLLFDFLIILSFIILSILSWGLLLKSHNVYQGLDTQFHFKRVMEIVESVKHGQIFPDFSFNQFHGSAVMTFYPYFNLLPAVFLSFFIKSKVILVYGFFIFNTFMTFIISFFSSKNYMKTYSTAYVFAIVYSLSNVFLIYNLTLADFGIASSYTFLPLVFFGFLKLIQGQDSWIELSLGMALLLFSHILNLFIVSSFLLLFLLVNIKRVNKQMILNLIKSIILFLIIGSIIWLPFLNLYIHNLGNIHMPFSAQLNNINIKEFMTGLYGSKSYNSIGTFPILGMFISIFFYKNFNRYIKQIYWLSLMIVMAVLFLPWHLITSYRIFSLLNQFQSTYRFLIIPQITFSFIFALIISKYIISVNTRYICYGFIIITAIVLQIIVGQYSFINKGNNALTLDDYLTKTNNILYIDHPPSYKFNDSSQFYKLMDSYQNTNDDYIPKNAVSQLSYVNKNLGTYNDYNKIKVSHIRYNTFSFNGRKNINKISLPLYIYKQEELNIYLNNQPVKHYSNENGLLTIDNIHDYIKNNNEVYIKPSYNIFKLIGIILSVSGLLFSLLLFIINILS